MVIVAYYLERMHQMDNDTLPWTRELVNRLGYPFHSARHWKISFTESDINYIETVIMADKL